jgi:uncharacterized membrane protein YdbT with pleckstrin-like domain
MAEPARRWELHTPHEKVAISVRAHWIEWAQKSVPAVLGFLAVLVVDRLLAGRVDGLTLASITLLVTITAILWVWSAYEVWKADHMWVTNTRIVMQRGITHRILKMAPLTNTMYVRVNETPWGRTFGYASLEVFVPGEYGQEILNPAPTPHALANQIMRLVKEPPPPPESGAPPRVGAAAGPAHPPGGGDGGHGDGGHANGSHGEGGGA